ncbi:MAG: putative rRNA maturation factor [Candidatus Cloacimonadota bacterium]|nr:putative rRNA maturation factor [Candidatus Cloacimonadota bacterium]
MTKLDIQGELPEGISSYAIQDFADFILRQEARECHFQISLLLTNSEAMQEYNRKYRGVDSSTDVLTFVGEILDLGIGNLCICDIIIDTNQVFKQKGKNTYREEFWQVLIHALLHLAGYDHIRSADRKKMEDAEDNYRKQIPGDIKLGF